MAATLEKIIDILSAKLSDARRGTLKPLIDGLQELRARLTAEHGRIDERYPPVPPPVRVSTRIADRAEKATAAAAEEIAKSKHTRDTLASKGAKAPKNALAQVEAQRLKAVSKATAQDVETSILESEEVVSLLSGKTPRMKKELLTIAKQRQNDPAEPWKDEALFRYLDTYHDFFDAQRNGGFTRSESDAYATQQVARIMRPLCFECGNSDKRHYTIPDDITSVKGSFERGAIRYMETQNPTLFHVLEESEKGQSPNDQYIKLSVLVDKKDYYTKMKGYAYAIVDDLYCCSSEGSGLQLTQAQLAILADNLRGYLETGADKIICDGSAKNFIKSLLSNDTAGVVPPFNYVLSWASQFDSAEVIGVKKLEGAVYLPEITTPAPAVPKEHEMDVSRIFLLTGVKKVKYAYTPADHDIKITFVGGLLDKKTYSTKEKSAGLPLSELACIIRCTEAMLPGSTFPSKYPDQLALLNDYLNLLSQNIYNGSANAKNDLNNYETLLLSAFSHPMCSLFYGRTAEEVIKIALDIKATGDASQVEFMRHHMKDIAFMSTVDLLTSLHARSRNCAVAFTSMEDQLKRTMLYKGLTGDPYDQALQRLDSLIRNVNPIISLAAEFAGTRDILQANINREIERFNTASPSFFLNQNKWMKYLVGLKILDTCAFLKTIVADLAPFSFEPYKAVVTQLANKNVILKPNLKKDDLTLKRILEVNIALSDHYKTPSVSVFEERLKNFGSARYLEGGHSFEGAEEFQRFIQENSISPSDVFNFKDIQFGNICHHLHRYTSVAIEEAGRGKTTQTVFEGLNRSLETFCKLFQHYKPSMRLEVITKGVGADAKEWFEFKCDACIPEFTMASKTLPRLSFAPAAAPAAPASAPAATKPFTKKGPHGGSAPLYETLKELLSTSGELYDFLATYDDILELRPTEYAEPLVLPTATVVTETESASAPAFTEVPVSEIEQPNNNRRFINTQSRRPLPKQKTRKQGRPPNQPYKLRKQQQQQQQQPSLLEQKLQGRQQEELQQSQLPPNNYIQYPRGHPDSSQLV